MFSRTVFTISILLTAVMTILSCASPSPTSPRNTAPVINVTGTWRGVNMAARYDTITLSLQQQDASIEGKIKALSGFSGDIVGSINNHVADLSILADAYLWCDLRVVLSFDSISAQGYYESPACPREYPGELQLQFVGK